MAKLLNPLPVCKAMCKSCPFRDGSKHASLRPYLTLASLSEGRICHSTGKSVFYGNTKKPEKICRGSRDLQLKAMWEAGVIVAPTDEAWDQKVKEINDSQNS